MATGCKWVIGILIGMVVVLVVVVAILLQPNPSCCVIPGDYMTNTAIAATNQMVLTYIAQTGTPLPYEPTLYAQRRQQERDLQTAAGPTEYAIFYGTEGALIATFQGTVVATGTPSPN